MYVYTIFSIKEEFAKHYFYKSDILFRFMKAYLQNRKREDLRLQFDYITKQFSNQAVLDALRLEKKNEVLPNKDGKEILINRDNRYVALHIKDKILQFRTETLHDAKQLLFPGLRFMESHLFVIDHNDHYGWFSPLAAGKILKNEEVLYSYH